jgi:hypothetical protein
VVNLHATLKVSFSYDDNNENTSSARVTPLSVNFFCFIAFPKFADSADKQRLRGVHFVRIHFIIATSCVSSEPLNASAGFVAE